LTSTEPRAFGDIRERWPRAPTYPPLVAVTVLDPGPISHDELIRYDDPDIETGLEQSGHDSKGATYRLLQLDLDELEEMRWVPDEAARFGTSMTEALRRGEELPPIVVVRTNRGRGFGLIDGLNRTHAHWAAGRESIQAYELLLG
jgi:hypothetical protein